MKKYNVIRGIIEAGNCVYCGRHIKNKSRLFLCDNCRREEKCLHEKQRAADIDTARPERPTMGKEPKRKPKGRGEP